MCLHVGKERTGHIEASIQSNPVEIGETMLAKAGRDYRQWGQTFATIGIGSVNSTDESPIRP